MQVAQYLSADLAPLARRFWAPTAAPGSPAAPATSKRTMLARVHEDVAAALWALHPMVHDTSAQLSDALHSLPPLAHPAACSARLAASPDGACLHVHAASSYKYAAVALAHVRGMHVLDMTIPGARHFGAHASSHDNSLQASGVVSGSASHSDAASEAYTLLRAAMDLSQQPLLCLHFRVPPAHGLLAQLTPRLCRLAITGSWAAELPLRVLPAPEQLQHLTSLEWHDELSRLLFSDTQGLSSGEETAAARTRAAALQATLVALPSLIALRISEPFFSVSVPCVPSGAALTALTWLDMSQMVLVTRQPVAT
jgi:hypothetical protein